MSKGCPALHSLNRCLKFKCPVSFSLCIAEFHDYSSGPYSHYLFSNFSIDNTFFLQYNTLLENKPALIFWFPMVRSREFFNT